MRLIGTRALGLAYGTEEDGMGKKRAEQGHLCWSCQRRRANERFSGRGHARHLCRDCAKLSADELAYRRGVQDVDRLLTWDGMIHRRQRQTFDRFLHHSNERVRNYARAIAARIEQEHARRRADWLLEAEADALWDAEFVGDLEASDLSEDDDDGPLEREEECLPF